MTKTFRQQTVDNIRKFSKEKKPFELETECNLTDKKILIPNFSQMGIMPEVFKNGSSEEKLWAKSTDIYSACILSYMGLETKVLKQRSNSADLYAKAPNYSLASDPKCFRFSRTAKNSKDFKVSALSRWRKESKYALLIVPMLSYPIDKSQIYSEAFLQNVTILSYTHLQFIAEKGVKNDLEKLWNLPTYIKKNYKPEDYERGKIYWDAADKVVCEITGLSDKELEEYKNQDMDKLANIMKEEENYLTAEVEYIDNLTHEQLAKLAKTQLKKRIQTIKKRRRAIAKI